jgi:hypothetical protein
VFLAQITVINAVQRDALNAQKASISLSPILTSAWLVLTPLWSLLETDAKNVSLKDAKDAIPERLTHVSYAILLKS